MLIADVNIFLYAFRKESPAHHDHRQWLTDALGGAEPFGVSDVVLSGFLRIVTNHRVYVEPTPPERALEFCTAVLGAPAAVAVRTGTAHWDIFSGLVKSVGARANRIPDAWLAALAIEHGATWITTDAGFATFPGLRWRKPVLGPPTS